MDDAVNIYKLIILWSAYSYDYLSYDLPIHMIITKLINLDINEFRYSNNSEDPFIDKFNHEWITHW